MTITIKCSTVPRPEGDDLTKRCRWWEALSQLPVSKLQLPSNPALIPPPGTLCFPSHHFISQSEILGELIPGNCLFWGADCALLVTQCVNLLSERETLNLEYNLSESTMCLSWGLSHSEMPCVNMVCQSQQMSKVSSRALRSINPNANVCTLRDTELQCYACC